MTDIISAYMKETGYLDKGSRGFARSKVAVKTKAKVSAKDVAIAFNSFHQTYEKFREDNGLNKAKRKKANMFEMCTALMDKGGRIARQLKHKERNDAKPDWPDGMTEAMTGYIIYMLLILDSYGLDMTDGMVKELESAIKQYSK